MSLPITTDDTTLSLVEAYCLAYLASETRGWPNHGVRAGIADKVVWLEQHGFGGLTALAHEFKNFDAKPGARGTACPLVASAMLSDQLGEFISDDPDEMRVLRGTTTGVILMQTVAGFAAQAGYPVAVSWLTGDPLEAAAVTTTDGKSFETHGDLNALLSSEAIGFSRARNSSGLRPPAKVDTVRISQRVLNGLVEFIGAQRLDLAIKVDALLGGRDAAGHALLKAISPADLATNGAAATMDEASVMLTSKKSANHKFRDYLTRLGWAKQVPEQSIRLDPMLAESSAAHELTDIGRIAVAMLVGATDMSRLQRRTSD